MASYRSLFALALLQSLVLFAFLSTGVSAGVSVPCNNCLVTQLNAQPTCTGINLTNTVQQNTQQFKTCICDASFDFNWTNACSTICQPSELSTFKSDFSVIITTLNITCVKPTPSPTPTPSAATGFVGTTGTTAMTIGWTLVAALVMAVVTVVLDGDDTRFSPEEFPNVVFAATGKVQGKIRLVHDVDDGSSQGQISSRVWVTKESDKDDVRVRTSFENKTFTYTLEGPTRFGAFSIYHETMIQVPRSTTFMNSLRVDAPNTSFSGDDLLELNWGSVTSQLSNSSIAFQTLSANSLSLRTSNSSISGSFDAGQIELQTSNSSISAKLRVKEDVHGRQSVVSTKTSNSSITLHVNAVEAINGLWMDNITKNGKINVGALLGHSNTQSSFINLKTENSRIELNLDASQTGQPLEVNTKTSNSTITSSIMVPRNEPFKCVVETSNSSANLNLTEDFQGYFEVSTSNSSANVEGSGLSFDKDKKSHKTGTRGLGQGNVKVTTSNSSANLRFYPAGDSLTSSYY
ncbi:hypothetical protein CPB97_005932 [Podila verticillata]|nr:hypothetical protein CPB97_005932 [Podila verticillata]